MYVDKGLRTRVRRLGERADYCPGCLQLARFKVRSMDERPYLFVIPLEDWKEVSRASECTICGAVFNGIKSYSKLHNASLEQLLAETNPGMTPEQIAGGKRSWTPRALKHDAKRR